MSSNQKKILSFLTLFIGSYFVFKYYVNHQRPMETRSHYQKQNESVKLNPFYKSRSKKKSKKYNTADGLSVSKSNLSVNESIDGQLRELDLEIQKRSKQCEEWLANHLIDDEFIDVNASLYEDKDAMLWLFHESFSKVLMREPADKAYLTIENFINTNDQFNPIDYYTKLESLDICRFPKIINFIDTIIEASVKLNWPEEDLQSIIKTVLDTGLLENNPSMETMLFQLNMLRVLIEAKLIPEALTEEIDIMITSLQDHEVNFRQGFGPNYRIQENQLALKEFLLTNREYWEDLKELLERTKFNLGL
jgi:hypothetical protein